MTLRSDMPYTQQKACILCVIFASINGLSASEYPDLQPFLESEKASKRAIPDLPDLSSVFTNETKTGIKYDFMGCELEVAKDGCKIVFIPVEETCKEKAYLSMLFSYMMKRDISKDEITRIIPFQIFYVERFNIDKCKSDVEFETLATESFDIIKDKIKVRKAHLSANFDYKDLVENYHYRKIGIEIQGNVELGKASYPFVLTKARGIENIRFLIKAESIDVSLLITLFYRKSKLEDELPSADLSIFLDAKLSDPFISGAGDVNGSYEFTCKGDVAHIPDVFGQVSLSVIAKKGIDEPIKVGIVAELVNSLPVLLLSRVTQENLTRIPLLKDLGGRFTFELSNGDMVSVNNTEINRMLKNYVRDDKMISKGVKIKTEMPFKNVKERTINTTLSSEKDSGELATQIFILDKKLDIRFPQNAVLYLFAILFPFMPDHLATLLKQVLDKSPSVSINLFDINMDTEEVHIVAVAVKNVSVGYLIELENAEFTMTHVLNKSSQFYIKATKKIDKDDLKVVIFNKGDHFEFSGKIRQLTMKGISKHLGKTDASIFSRMPFLNFPVNDVNIHSVFGENVNFQLTGTPSLFGWNSTLMGLIFKRKHRYKSTFEIVIKDFKIDEMVEKFYGKRLLQTSWMPDLTAVLRISNTNSNGLNFSEFTDFRKGVFFSTVVSIPKYCNSDVFCEVLQKKADFNTEFHLAGEITASGCLFSAAYKGRFLFGENFYLDRIAMVVNVGVEAEFYIEGEATIKELNLTFTGRLAVGKTGRVELMLSSDQMWVEPYNLPFVQFTGLKINRTIFPQTYLEKLELSADMLLGTNVAFSSKVIGQASIVFYSQGSVGNFFYAQIKPLTFKNISDAFEFYVALPRFLKSTEFPGGLVAGFTRDATGKSINHLATNIPTGFSLKGTISIMGMMLLCSFEFRYPLNFSVFAHLPPFSVGGELLSLRKSMKDSENGPMLSIHMSGSSVKANIKGYAELLGIGRDVTIRITDKEVAFSLSGKLFNFVQARVFVWSPFGNGDIVNARYSVSSCLTSSASKVAVEASNVIKHGAELTAKTLQTVRIFIKSAASWYEHAFQKLKKWNFVLERRERSIQRKAHRLSIIQKYLDSSCVDLCPEVCIGGPTTNANCKNILGKQFPCPEWDNCKSKIEDSVCIAKCVGKKVYYEGKAGRKRNAMMVLSDGTIVIKNIMEKMKAFVIQAKQLEEMTQRTALKVKELSLSGQHAISQISNFSKEELITVRRICFNTSLQVASSSCFHVTLDIMMGGIEEYLFGTEICIDTRFTQTLGKWIADQLFPGISTINDKMNEAEAYFKKVKELMSALETKSTESDEIERDMQSKIEAIVDQDDEVEVTKQKEKVPVQKMSDADIRHQIYGFSPSVHIQDDYIMEVFEKKSPWAFSHRDSPFILRKGTTTGEVQKESLSLDIMALEDPGDTSKCSPTQSVVNTYSMMADTIDVLLQKADEERTLFNNTVKMYTKSAEEAEKEIVNNCKSLNMTQERTNDALFYIRKVKNGTNDWMKTVTRQIEFQDKEALEMWRKSFMDLMSTNRNLDIPRFLEILNSVTAAAKGRHELPTTNHLANEFIVKFTVATKVVNELLVGELGSLSLKKESIQNFVSAAKFLKKKMRIDCAT